MQNLPNLPLLTKEEERDLIYRSQMENDKEAKELLVLSNLGLVKKALSMFHSYSVLDSEDLFHEGVLGLMKAVDSFDLSYDVKFSTYAIMWIKQYIRRCLANTEETIRIPVHMTETVSQINRFSSEFLGKHNRLPTKEEIMKELNIPEQKVDFYFNYKKTVSLNSVQTEDGKNELMDIIPDTDSPFEDVVIDQILFEEVKDILEKVLSKKEREVIYLRFGLEDTGHPHTLQEIADMKHLSRERIRQIENIALRKIKRNIQLRKLYIS